MAKSRTSKGQAGSRQRRPLTDDLITEIALARYSPDGKGNPLTSLPELAHAFGRDKTVISRACRDALLRGLVEMRATGTGRAGLRDLEEELEAYFPGVRVIVVECGEELLAEEQSEPAASDHVHSMLGDALAAELAAQPYAWFRSGSMIALGSGRGVFSVVDAMLDREVKIRSRDVRLISACGSVLVRHHNQDKEILDADSNVNLFARCFTGGVSLTFVGTTLLPIIRKKKAKGQYIVDALETLAEWRDLRPDVAIIGLGVLAGRHQLVRMSDEGKVDGPVTQSLETLVEICRTQTEETGGLYCPVGDCCNALFYVPPPPPIEHSDEASRKIRQLIQTVNEHVVTFKHEWLNGFGSLLLVAGTRLKARAVHTFLRMRSPKAKHNRYPIQLLCINRAVARMLVSWERGEEDTTVHHTEAHV